MKPTPKSLTDRLGARWSARTGRDSQHVVDRVRSLLGQTRVRPARGAPALRPDWLIAGLGNPGAKYAGSRHNVGFRCVERIAEQSRLSFDQTRRSADLAAGTVAGQPVWLAKPRTYMNLSGAAIGPLLRDAGLAPDRLIVIYDELDLPFGTIRIRQAGSAGGHNGMKSVIHALVTQEFPRIRVGIGRPAAGQDAVEYVLGAFTRDEAPVIESIRDQVAEAVAVILQAGLGVAMNQFNRKT